MRYVYVYALLVAGVGAACVDRLSTVSVCAPLCTEFQSEMASAAIDTTGLSTL